MNQKTKREPSSSRFTAGWNYERGSSDRNVDTDLAIGLDVQQEEPAAEQSPDRTGTWSGNYVSKSRPSQQQNPVGHFAI